LEAARCACSNLVGAMVLWTNKDHQYWWQDDREFSWNHNNWDDSWESQTVLLLQKASQKSLVLISDLVFQRRTCFLLLSLQFHIPISFWTSF
jgi:hypothetical protein